MATKTKSGLKAAFDEFVDLVRVISEIRHVVALDEDGGEIFTLIDQRNDDVCRLIFKAEKQIRWKFVSEEIDFHVVYLQDRTLAQIFAPLPLLVFSRDA